MDIPDMPSRRDFLKGSGVLVVAFSFAVSKARALELNPPPPADDLPEPKVVDADQVAAFLAIDDTGHVTVYSGKVELGTGVETGIAQIVAEELYVPMERVGVVQGDTALTPDQGPTYGSLTIEKGGMQIRQAAATALGALLEKAASHLGVAKESLVISDGAIATKSGEATVTYAELIGDGRFSMKVDPKATPKDPADYTIVGKPIPRVDIPGKITGAFTYMQDYRVPGMLHGRVVRPPAIGARLLEVDESSISGIPGIVKVVRIDSFLGIVAESEWAAVRAARDIMASWSKSETLPDQDRIWEHVRSTKVVKDDVTSDIGNVNAAMAADGTKLSATYKFAINTHGSIGPSCAITEFRDGKLISWSASQATHRLHRQLATMFSMPPEDVRCVYIEGSGCYGRNGHEDAAADSALLAKAVGRPVRVQWSRADEHVWDPKGPPFLIDLRASIDASGMVTAWDSEFFIPQGAGGPVELLPAEFADMPRTQDLNPGGITNDSAISYTFPNIRTVCHRLETTPLRPSWVRAPGRLQNTFANECFFDEIASELGVDPLEMRIEHTDPADERGHAVLDSLVSLSKWEKRPSPQQDITGNIVRGRGCSYVKYELKRTYVGSVAEVEVNRLTGDIAVKRFYIVHDCGQIINPGGVRSQIEGNVIQTVSRALKEKVTFDRSAVTSVDWASYPILTFPEIPEIVIHLIDRPTEAPLGVGEPTAAVISSAISNAVFDATGARLRSVPFTAEKVRAALRSG